jgi:hypothetical protein
MREAMRFESSVTSVSWIPSEAVTLLVRRLPFKARLAHYDSPPPDFVDDAAAYVAADRCRFANLLKAWIEVQDGVIVDCGQVGRGYVRTTTLLMAGLRFAAVALPDRHSTHRLGETAVRFEQSVGGRMGLPAKISWSREAASVRIADPLAWTTLAMTLHADGSAQCELVGASPFPRHWVYDGAGRLHSKSAVMDFKTWSGSAFAQHTPWGEEDSDVVVRAVESALERELSSQIMAHPAAVRMRRLVAGAMLAQEGALGDELYLLLDGVVRVEVDGQPVAEVGPGAILGERAMLEDGRRTATLRAVTQCAVAVAPSSAVSRDALQGVAETHHRETDGIDS